MPPHILERYGAAMDVVSRQSRRSTCFTKNYSRYIKGAAAIRVTPLYATYVITECHCYYSPL